MAVDPSDARWPVCADVNAYFEGNLIEMIYDNSVSSSPNVGGYFSTVATWNLNSTLINNEVYFEGENSGGGIFELGYNGNHDWTPMNHTAWLIGNTMYFNDLASSSPGGFIKIFAEPDIGELDAYLIDNTLKADIRYNDGGWVQIGGLLTEDPPANVTALVQGNEFIGKYYDASYMLFFECMAVNNTRLDFVDNTVYMDDTDGGVDPKRLFRIGTHENFFPDYATRYLYLNMTDNIIYFNAADGGDYSGGLCMFNAIEYIGMNMDRNQITMKHRYYTNSHNGIQPFWIGDITGEDVMVQDMDLNIRDNYFEFLYQGDCSVASVFRLVAYGELTINISGNYFDVDIMSSSSSSVDLGGFICAGYEADSSETAVNVTFNMYNNYIDFMVVSAYYTYGAGFLRLTADNELYTNIVGNEWNFIWQAMGSSYTEGGGFLWLGDYNDYIPVNHTVVFNDNIINMGLYGGYYIGTPIRMDADDTLDVQMNNNEITVDSVSAYFGDLGGIVRFGPDHEPRVIRGEFNGNTIISNISEEINGGGTLRVKAYELIDLDIHDNVMQNFQVYDDEDNAHDMGVRIGYECESNGIVTENVTLNMSNNHIGPGGVGAALSVGAIDNLDFTLDGGVLEGTLYCDGYGNPAAYGNGLTLQGSNITASIANVEILNNHGAGIYVESQYDTTIDILNTNIHDNYWHGIYLNSLMGTVDATGSIEDCQIVDNGNNYNNDLPDFGDGLYVNNANAHVVNTTFSNPDANFEVEMYADSYVEFLNCDMDTDDVFLASTPATLIGGYSPETNLANWQAITNGEFNLSIDGMAFNVGPINFTGVVSMVEVASRIQNAIQAVGVGQFPNTTCIWNMIHFEINSGSTGTGSTIAVLASTGTGTDISGLGLSTPATLVCGSNEEPNVGNWAAVTDGTFRITIDGTASDVGPIDFTGVITLNDVATRIQIAIQAVGIGSFTTSICVWTGTNFVIRAGSTGTTTTITNISAHSTALGTDISGLTLSPGGAWMDGADSATFTMPKWFMDSANNGTVTASTTASMLVQWFMNVKAQQLVGGGIIPGATITVRDIFNTVVATGTTGMDGWLRWIPVNSYYREVALSNWDEMYYTAHTVDGQKLTGTGTASPNPFMDATKNVLVLIDYVSEVPVANAGLDQFIDDGSYTIIDGSSSTDDYGIVSYEWAVPGYGPLMGAVQNVSFLAVGVYNLTLTVTDVEGYTVQDYMIVTVMDVTSPVVSAGMNQIVNEDALVTLNGSMSTDDMGIANYTWTFTDGVPITLYGNITNYIFVNPGIYTVTLKCTDLAGNNGTDVVVITVLDITSPVPDAGLNQTEIQGQPVNFNASASTDNVGIVSYEWVFNDGANDIVMTGPLNHYIFMTLGSYEVTLTCTDAAGNTANDIMFVNIVDNDPPEILVVAPGESLAGVPINWALIIVFDEPMDTASVEAAFNISGSVVVTSYTWDVTYQYVEIIFGSLEYGTTYTFTVDTGACDEHANNMTTNYTGIFSTIAAPDTNPPDVLAVSPGESLSDVPINWILTLVFDESMDTASVEAAFTTSGDMTVTSYTWDLTHQYVSIAFSELNYATTYTFSVGTGASDIAGNHMAAAYTNSFVTAAYPDTVPPKVMVMTPGDGLTEVAIDSSLTIVFDEPVDTASVEAAFNVSGGLTVTGFTWDATHQYVKITFSPMSNATLYTITIGTGASDVSGNNMAAAYTNTFTTIVPPILDGDQDGIPAETNFWTNNWWLLVVIIVVLAVLLLAQMTKGGSKEPAPPKEELDAPEAEPETEAAPEAETEATPEGESEEIE